MIDLNKHAEAILRAAGMPPLDVWEDADQAAILTACAALADDARKEGFEAGRQAMAKEIGPHMRVDPAAIMPQSSGVSAAVIREINASLMGEK